MIKITFISTLAYNYFFPGKIRQAGGHTRFYNLSRKFAENPNYEVSCVVGDFGQPNIMEKEGVKIVKAPVDDPFAIIKVLKILSSLKSDVYVDFCASPRLFLLYLLKKMNSAKYFFFTGHDNDVNSEYRNVENSLFYLFYIFGLKRADAVISQVPQHVKMLKNNYDIDSELVLSPYFDITPPNFSKLKKQHILWVGRAAEYKNPHLFLDLSKKFPDEKFVMICNKSSYDKGFFSRIIKDVEKSDNFTFLDYVPYPEMKKYFETAKVLINTSKYEGFSNTFIEAAMNYTPVISLNSNPNNMLTNYQAGFFCDGSFQNLIDCVSEISKSNVLQKKMGENACRYAIKFHQIDVAAGKIDKIIRTVMQEPV